MARCGMADDRIFEKLFQAQVCLNYKKFYEVNFGRQIYLFICFYYFIPHLNNHSFYSTIAVVICP
jgi:hypothetical protein